MEKTRKDLKACLNCGVLNSLENLVRYGCNYQFVKDPLELIKRLDCEYFDHFNETCGISDCLGGCCLLCSDLKTCLSRCFKAKEKRGLSR